MPRISLRLLLAAGLVAGGLVSVTGAAAAPTPAAVKGADDVTVVAVIDSGFQPYHWDFLAAKMPQAKTKDRNDDLPLTKAPHTWLPGFPKPSTFQTYQQLNLTLDAKDPDASPAELMAEDDDEWAKVTPSNDEAVHYAWLPGTKVIGALAFAPEDAERGTLVKDTTAAHGNGTSSVSVGNIYGACPECVVLFIQYADQAHGEMAIDWAMRQPWIDVISNSYGFSAAERDRLYNGSSTELQREATERGQAIFFSSGNGISNTFSVPNQTLLSSQEGPDWIVTVGATDPVHNRNYPGTGKPADIAGVGSGYPSAYNATTVTNGKPFGGTSNATPTISGTYARALHVARTALPGRSRLQKGGVIARGKPGCAAVRRDCELRDGILTGRELLLRLFRSATPSKGGFTDLESITDLPPVADERYLSEGHGTYRVRLDGDQAWAAEFARITGPLLGRAAEPKRPAGEVDWMRVDSYCRQHIWGEWTGGYYLDEERTPRPGNDPAWPSRTAYANSCERMQPPPRTR